VFVPLVHLDVMRDLKLPPRNRETNSLFWVMLFRNVGKKFTITRCVITQTTADLSYVDAGVINKIQYNFKASLNLQYNFVMVMYTYSIKNDKYYS
jgi:hypothetical protein